MERQLTHAAHGHILTNTGVWSPDGQWIVYDVRSDPAGSVFDGARIEQVHVQTGEIQVLYEAKQGAHVGVATYSPIEDKVVFIHGPERPTRDWSYGPQRRRGVLVDVACPGVAVNLDARDLSPPFTLGALRGGTHLHVFSGEGQWISFTYQDHLLAILGEAGPDHDIDQRNVGLCVPCGPVIVSRDHPRNHDGTYFSVLVTRTTTNPLPGSDEIIRACEEGWVGKHGYLKSDGTRQHRAVAFQGQIAMRTYERERDVDCGSELHATAATQLISEVFIVDLPDDVMIAGDRPLQGTQTRRPAPPRGVRQRRLTFTADRRFPGLAGPRHWLRSAPDGSRIACLMKDDRGIVQLWTVSPNGGPPQQLTDNRASISSAFSWSPDGRFIAHAMDNDLCITNAASGQTTPLPTQSDSALRPEACVFSPDGSQIAYVRNVRDNKGRFNQIFARSLAAP